MFKNVFMVFVSHVQVAEEVLDEEVENKAKEAIKI